MGMPRFFAWKISHMNYLASNLAYLRGQKALKQADLGEKLNTTRQTISNWEKKVSEPSVEDIFKIAQFFGVTIDELVKEDLRDAHLLDVVEVGKIQSKSTAKSTSKSTSIVASEPSATYAGRVPKVVTVDSAGRDNVLLVPVRARAGYLAGYEDPEYLQTLPSYRLPGLTHGTFRAFEIEGHSMIPTFHPSDIIFSRWVENLLEIRDDRVYVVVTQRDGVVVKRILNRVQKDRKLILKSDNQRHPGEYPPIVLDPEEVLEIWDGVMYLSRQMRSPGELYQRVIDLEGRLTILEESSRIGRL